jgi:hypothetical protein
LFCHLLKVLLGKVKKIFQMAQQANYTFEWK